VFSEEDKHLIQVSRKTRHLGARRIIKLSRKEMDIKLNAVDYKMWGIMQDRFYSRKITSGSVDKLEQCISDEWDKIDQHLIDSAIKQWRKRLAACVSAQGGHIEHLL